MRHQRHDTRLCEPDQRLLHWGAISRAYFGDLEVECMDEAGLVEAELRSYALDDLRVCLIETPAHRVSRRARHVQDMLDDSYKLLLLRRGHARIELGGRQVALRPGDWSLYDPRQPYRIENIKPASLMVIQIPRARLRDIEVPELHTSDETVSGGTGLPAVMSAFLASLAQQLPALPDQAAAALPETFVGLLRSALCGSAPETAHANSAAVMKARIRQYVRQNLADPGLSASRIAQELRCSRRYLHRLFEDEEQTLERFIWRQRLEQTRARLARADGTRPTAAEVAFSHGFSSTAHFCRLFKKEYGITPARFRDQEALAAAGENTR